LKSEGKYVPDALDFKIMTVLQDRCNLSVRKLAKELEVPTSTVQRRIANLQDLGILKGYRAVINKEYLGYITLFSLVKVTTGFLKDEGGYLESFSEGNIRDKYGIEPDHYFIMDKSTRLKANPWEFVLDVFNSLTPKEYGNEIASIQIIYALHGRYDILLKIIGTDQKICGKYIEDKIAIIPGVTGVESFTVFDVKKDEARVPFRSEI
jgi:Lrp/AsnC family leucine-responsive transcriptional regulator